MSKALQRSAAVLAALAAALLPAPALADDPVTAFTGQWNTNAAGVLVGSVKLSVIDAGQGAQALSDLFGTPCAAPTTYYHGDYKDNLVSGTLTACTVGTDRLVGRLDLSIGRGNFDVSLTDPTDFSGSFAIDGSSTSGSIAGTFAAHFPGDGCCPGGAPSAGGAPSGGGGGAAGGPSPGATTQTAGASAPGGAVTTAAGSQGLAFCSDAPAPPCAPDRIVRSAEKTAWRVTLSRQRRTAAALCALSSAPGLGPQRLAALCASQVGFIADALALIHDPPDRAYRRLALPHLLRRADPRARGLGPAAQSWAQTLGATAALSRALAQTVNRFGAAAAAGDADAAFLQAAIDKVLTGRLASALDAQAAAGKAYATALRRAERNPRVSGAAAKVRAAALDQIVAAGLAPSRTDARHQIAAQLAQATGTLRLASVADAPLPTTELTVTARTITLADLRALVIALGAQRVLPAAAQQTLLADLAAGDACRFATDAKTLPPATYGPVLATAAAPACD